MKTLSKLYAVAVSLPLCALFALSAEAAVSKLSVVNDEWTLITIPADPDSNGTVQRLIADDLPAGSYGDDWFMFGWQKQLSAQSGEYFFDYVPLTPQSVLTAGQAYWFIQITGSTVELDLPNSLSDAEPRVIRGCQSIVGCTSVPVEYVRNPANPDVSWNAIGVPRAESYDFKDIRVVADSGVCSTGCTLNEADAADLVFSTLFGFPNESTGYVSYTQSSTGEAWSGFWIGVLPGAENKGVRLEIPEPLPPAQTPDLSEYRLVFNDEFDGPTLDSTKWNTGLLWGPYIVINQEEQFYVDSLGMHQGHSYDPFSFTPEGHLRITASPVSEVGAPPPIPAEDDPVWNQYLEYRSPGVGEPPYVEEDMNYLSGLLNTYEPFKFTHGYVETRAKVPAGQGLWPAFWLLPTHYVEDVPEIDVMEFLGQNRNEVYHTYHYFDVPAGWQARRTPSYETIGPDFSRDFHVYSASWDPAQIIWYVDGVETQRIDRSDYKIANQAMYLIANLAVGGTWPQSPDSTTEFPAVFEIDYIRAYSRDMSSPLDLSEYELVFSDEFNGSELDASKWNTRFIWGPFLTINDEEQYYVDSLGIDSNDAYSPFLLSNGVLTIRGAAVGTEIPENTAPPAYPADHPFWNDKPSSFYQESYVQKQYTSGIITSYDSFRFTHGYAEIKAKVPVGDGLWPAFWLLNRYYVGRQPEIDIMEILGENPGEVVHSFHRRNDLGVSVQTSFRSTGGSGTDGFGDDFHTFGVQWTDNSISWYVDGELKHTYEDESVSYQVMYVLANLAVGGSFNQEEVDPAALPAEYAIDYIRVYQQKPVP